MLLALVGLFIWLHRNMEKKGLGRIMSAASEMHTNVFFLPSFWTFCSTITPRSKMWLAFQHNHLGRKTRLRNRNWAKVPQTHAPNGNAPNENGLMCLMKMYIKEHIHGLGLVELVVELLCTNAYVPLHSNNFWKGLMCLIDFCYWEIWNKCYFRMSYCS